MNRHDILRRWSVWAMTIAAFCAVLGDVHECCAVQEQPAEHLLPSELRRRVENLYAEDTPWRKIEWRICLLDGIRESARTGKPMVLWIFIDRPIDDERC